MTVQNIATLAARNIARRRKAAGYTQAQVAELLSVEKESISRMESGKIALNLERLQQFADIYGCTVAEFLQDESPQLHAQAQTIADILTPLSPAEREAVVRFIGEAARLFKTMNSAKQKEQPS